jgi:hypothetical protein
LRDHQDQNYGQSRNGSGKHQFLLAEIILIGLRPIRGTVCVHRGEEQKTGNRSHPKGKHQGNSVVWFHRSSVEKGLF